jgi:hypothetical protein
MNFLVAAYPEYVSIFAIAAHLGKAIPYTTNKAAVTQIINGAAHQRERVGPRSKPCWTIPAAQPCSLAGFRVRVTNVLLEPIMAPFPVPHPKR